MADAAAVLPLCSFQPRDDRVALGKWAPADLARDFLTLQAAMLDALRRGLFFHLALSADEVSVAYDTRLVLDPPPAALHLYEDRFRILELYCYTGEHGIDHVGVVSQISRVLSEVGVSILYVNTYGKNYVLVSAADYDRAVGALAASGVAAAV